MTRSDAIEVILLSSISYVLGILCLMLLRDFDVGPFMNIYITMWSVAFCLFGIVGFGSSMLFIIGEKHAAK